MPLITLTDIDQFIQEEIQQQEIYLKFKLYEELKLELQENNEDVLASQLLKIYNEQKKFISTEVEMIPVDNLNNCQKSFFSIINFRVAQKWVSLKNNIQETTNISNIIADDNAWNQFMKVQEKNEEKLVQKISLPDIQKYRDAINKDYRAEMRLCRLSSQMFSFGNIIKQIKQKFANECSEKMKYDIKSFEQIANPQKYFPTDLEQKEIKELENVIESRSKSDKIRMVQEQLLKRLFIHYKFSYRSDQKEWLLYSKWSKKQVQQFSVTEQLRQTFIPLLCLLKREMNIGLTIIEKEKAFYKFSLILTFLIQYQQPSILEQMEMANIF